MFLNSFILFFSLLLANYKISLTQKGGNYEKKTTKKTYYY